MRLGFSFIEAHAVNFGQLLDLTAWDQVMCQGYNLVEASKGAGGAEVESTLDFRKIK